MALTAGLSAAQVAGTGTTVSIGGVTGVVSGTEIFVPIGEIKDLKHSGTKRATTMSTNFASLGVARKIGTILDLGTLTMTCNRIGNDAGQIAVNAACIANGSYDFQVQMPVNALTGQTTKGDLITMSAIVTEAGSFDVSIDKVSEYTFTLDLNSYTVTAGS